MGKPITFEVEGRPQCPSQSGGGGPPRPGNTGDNKTNQIRGTRISRGSSKKSSSKFDRIGKLDREAESSQDESMEEAMETTEPLAAFLPGLGVIKDATIDSVKKVNDLHKPGQEVQGAMEIQYDPKF